MIEHLENLKKLSSYEEKLKFVHRLVRDEQIGMATFAVLIESFLQEKKRN